MPVVNVSELAGGLATDGIDSEARFVALSYHDGGLLLPGRTLKFLIDLRDRGKPGVYFMNSNFKDPDGSRPEAAKYHLHLGERVLEGFSETRESFSAKSYDTHQKTYIAGSIQTYYVEGNSRPLYGFQFFPQDVIREDEVVLAIRTLLPRFRIPDARLAFVATGQQQTVGEAARAELAKLGAPAKTLDDVLGAIDYIPLNRGEAWGYLRMFPKDMDALSAHDIPVFAELPLDLGVVAATITRDYQDPTSHVNLKSKERNTPNFVLRSAGPEHEKLKALMDRPVHLKVDTEGFTLTAASDEQVREHHAKRNLRPWVSLPYQPIDTLLSYDRMCPRAAAECIQLANAVGAKAASLGLLTQPSVLGQQKDAGSPSARLGYDLVPKGLGVPFKFYRDFVDYPANRELKDALSALIEQSKRGDATPKALAEAASRVRDQFLAARFPPGMLERLDAGVKTVLPGTPKVKVRSSANAEDMPNFDGAGLYTSFAANLEKEEDASKPCKLVSEGVKLKVKPRTLGCAVKGVFASLWNKRAIEERSFARLDHQSALMGIAIVRDYDLDEDIAANSVVITRVINSRNVYGYTIATQRDNVLVTNPTPGTLAENLIAAFNEPGERPSFAITRFATPVAGQPPLREAVLSEKLRRDLVEVIRAAEIGYCLGRPDYYAFDCRYAPADPNKTRALDFEVKVLASGKFVVKQMREFSGR